MASAAKLPKYTKQYNFDSPHRQEFSLPGTFMQYFSQNWSGAVYEKLIKSCKYFYSCHQIVPMKILTPGDLDYDEDSCYILGDQISVDLKECKVWVYGCIEFWEGSYSELFSLFLKSVYRCSSVSVDLWDQDIEVEDFAKISTNIKKISLTDTRFFYPDKTEASLWDMLKMMPKLEECCVNPDEKKCIISSTKDATIPILPNLKEFYFTKLPEDDFPTIAEFIKLYPNTKFEINIEEEVDEIDVKAFKRMLKETFPNTSITQEESDYCCEFQWTLESQYVRVQLG